jgi:glycosyltransferase involved in cell wall biosynthesis
MKKIKKEQVNIGVQESLEDFTVCIPTYNNVKTLTYCMDQLASQECEKLKVIICDTGSTDGTIEMVEAQIKNKCWIKPRFVPELDITLIKKERRPGDKAQNIVSAMETFMKEVKTPYMFRLDSDIVLSPNTLKPMLSSLKMNPTIGMLTVHHWPAKGHVTTNATVFEMETIRKVVWQWNGTNCDCLTTANQLRGIHKKVMYHPTLSCRHLKHL